MKKKVLIVDDSKVVKNFHSYILKMLGFEIKTADDGMMALEKVLVEHFDLIITDINMPKMDGYEFIKQVRQRKFKVPIIVVSTEDEYKDRLRGIRSGANIYLVKPTEPEQMVATVKKLLSE